MRWLVEVTIGGMLDVRSRRAIEETLLDWSHEAGRASGAMAALLCHLRAVLAICRTIAAIVAHEVAELPKNTVWLRVGLWLLASFVFFRLFYRSFVPAGAGVSTHLMMSLTMFPAWLVAFGPVALFLGAIWRTGADRPQTPFLGLAAVSLVVAFVNAGWVMPAGNQAFREVIFEQLGGRGSLRRGISELTLPELVASDPVRSQRSRQLDLSRRLAFVAACPVFVMLAGQLHGIRRRHRWLAGASMGLFVFGVVKLGVRPPLGDWVLLIGAVGVGVTIGVWRRSRSGMNEVHPTA